MNLKVRLFVVLDFLLSQMLVNDVTALPQKLPVGVHNFKELVEGDFVFVDKTELIQKMVTNDVSLSVFTRPRGFGKSITLSMLHYFLDSKYSLKMLWPLHDLRHQEQERLFDGLKISKHAQFCQQHQKNYAVIYVSFATVTGASYDVIEAQIEGCIEQAIRKHFKIENRGSFDRRFETVTANKKRPFQTALGDLVQLYKDRGMKTAVLIEDYDQPLYSAFVADDSLYKHLGKFERYEVYRRTWALVRRILVSTFKADSPSLGVLTGISPLSKATLFAGFDSCKFYSLVDDETFSTFGFTSDDVTVLSTGEKSVIDIKSWCNGYNIDNVSVFKPSSVIQYIQNGGRSESSSNAAAFEVLVRNAVVAGGDYILFQADLLLAGQSVTKIINKTLTLEEVYSNEEAFWTLLVNAGYLTASPVGNKRVPTKYDLKIPNQEMKEKWRNLVSQSDERKRLSDYELFLNTVTYLLTNDDCKSNKSTVSVTQHLTKYLSRPGSFFDFRKSNSPERYEEFFDGIFAGFRKRNYTVKLKLDSLRKILGVKICNKSKSEAPIVIVFKVDGGAPGIRRSHHPIDGAEALERRGRVLQSSDRDKKLAEEVCRTNFTEVGQCGVWEVGLGPPCNLSDMGEDSASRTTTTPRTWRNSKTFKGVKMLGTLGMMLASLATKPFVLLALAVNWFFVFVLENLDSIVDLLDSLASLFFDEDE